MAVNFGALLLLTPFIIYSFYLPMKKKSLSIEHPSKILNSNGGVTWVGCLNPMFGRVWVIIFHTWVEFSYHKLNLGWA